MPTRPHVQVALAPALVQGLKLAGTAAVAIDVWRFTTSLCTALHAGAAGVRPVATVAEAAAWQAQGHPAAAERGGRTLPGFRYGNSPHELADPALAGQTLAMSTTNGTGLVTQLAGAWAVLGGAFVNLSALTAWLAASRRPVVLACAGWQGAVNLEDTLLAGAVAHALHRHHGYALQQDAAQLARQVYLGVARRGTLAQHPLWQRAEHHRRMRRLNLLADARYALAVDRHPVVPLRAEDGVFRP